jgi:hypothetical protein
MPGIIWRRSIVLKMVGHQAGRPRVKRVRLGDDETMTVRIYVLFEAIAWKEAKESRPITVARFGDVNYRLNIISKV